MASNTPKRPQQHVQKYWQASEGKRKKKDNKTVQFGLVICKPVWKYKLIIYMWCEESEWVSEREREKRFQYWNDLQRRKKIVKKKLRDIPRCRVLLALLSSRRRPPKNGYFFWRELRLRRQRRRRPTNHYTTGPRRAKKWRKKISNERRKN